MNDMPPRNVVAVDAGGATLKASVVSGRAAEDAAAALLLANHVATTTSSGNVLLGKELLERERQGGTKLHYVRPIERGYCVNWNVETDIWSHLFSKKASGNGALGVDPAEHSLLTTAPLFAPTVLNETMDQVVFEEFGFHSYARVNAQDMCVLSYTQFCQQTRAKELLERQIASTETQESRSPAKRRRKTKAASTARVPLDPSGNEFTFDTSSCHLVVDSGFSFTHIVPIIDGRAYLPGVKRINVGGKLLTNYLKEIVSFRQWNVMDDTRVINELKEALCYCSMDFESEMAKYHNNGRSGGHRKHWILPDFVNSFQGRLRNGDNPNHPQNDDEQALELGIELITVPEVLFNPSDIGLGQAGLAEAILQAVVACPPELHSALYANILLVGGNTKFVNIRERLERELRSLAPAEYEIVLHQPHDPILTAWDGCTRFATSDEFECRAVSKQEYEEHGSNICRKRF
uniref:Actin-related protein 6 n=1 Tax=Globisporangium ultimum (strain ATCC 200006 / CBS 805.95 / DAOM BR144) TaxID=431595 RepID=K3X9H0_GLOUD